MTKSWRAASSTPRASSAAPTRSCASSGPSGSAATVFQPVGRVLAVREDVGRHNAVDKLVGWALAEGRRPLHDFLLMVSGRVGYEIVQKAIAAGLPIIAAVGAPSSLAIDLAEQF